MRSSALRLLLLLLAGLAPAPGLAQPFPSRPITIVVPEAPGGQSDRLARILAPELSKLWGQPVNVENDPAEGGRSAAWRVSRSSWDAYTLLLATTAILDDPKRHQFAPVATVATSPLVLLANARSKVAGVAGLVKIARARPGKHAYGALDAPLAIGLAGEHFKAVAGVDLRRVSFDSADALIAALASGKIDVAFLPLGEALAPLASGKAKALAVTGAARAHALPKVPTVAESGFPAFEAVGWQGLMLPIATPKPLVAIHNADANKVLEMTGVREKILALGAEPGGGSSGRLFDLMRMDREPRRKPGQPPAERK